MKSLAALIIAFLVIALPAAAQIFQGRAYLLTDGRTDTTQAAPLIVAMHGFLGTPRNMRKKARLDALANQHGFVVLYPKGKGRRWNDGRLARNHSDDVGYLSALVTALVAQGQVDRSRIFWAGHSNGGGMAMRMACERPDLVTGIAVVATKIPTKYPCAKGRAIPAIFFHGTADPIAPHDGRSADSRLGSTLSGAASLDLWAKRNRCRGAAAPHQVDRREDGTRAEVFRYTGCRAPLLYVLIHGHGHDWPAPGRKATRLQGPATQEIDAAAMIWRLFSGL